MERREFFDRIGNCQHDIGKLMHRSFWKETKDGMVKDKTKESPEDEKKISALLERAWDDIEKVREILREAQIKENGDVNTLYKKI